MATVAAVVTSARAPSHREVAADGVVHAVGLSAGIIGAASLITLVAAQHRPSTLVTATVYGFGLVAMLGCSAAYNMGRRLRCHEILRRLDQAAICAMIAGTYTPFTMLALDGAWAVVLTAAVWSIAAIGIGLKLSGLGGGSFGRWTCFYLAFGWSGVVAAAPFLVTLPADTLTPLVIGGVLYTVGTLFFVLQRVRYQRAIWHGIVLLAAAAHFTAIFNMIATS